VHQRRSASRNDLVSRDVLRSSRLGSGKPDSDVVVDAHVEEDATLLDRSDVLLHPASVEEMDILIVKRDRPTSGLVKPEEKLGDSRLARAGSADDEGGLASGEKDGDVGEGRDMRTGGIGEGYIPKNELAVATKRADVSKGDVAVHAFGELAAWDWSSRGKGGIGRGRGHRRGCRGGSSGGRKGGVFVVDRRGIGRCSLERLVERADHGGRARGVGRSSSSRGRRIDQGLHRDH
jgi:hypothetical protein